MILTILAVIVVLFILTSLLFGYFLSAPGYTGKKSDHFDGKKFVNPGNVQAKGFLDVLKWGLNRDAGKWTENYETYVGTPVKADSESSINITFINHSTFLIHTGQATILTDPVWSERVSPFEFAGPARYRPPGIRFEDLPEIDIVIISHNHYDHLDENTISKLKKDHDPLFVVPLGVKAFMENFTSRVEELDWWKSISVKEVNIHAVPAIHFSGRGMFDRDKTLWCGYVLSLKGKKVYFAGDTGYGKIFKEIGEKHGPIDISLIPIGAYKPEWFMSPIHTSPFDAVDVHLDVKSKTSIAIHFGTFALADEGQGQAEFDLKNALKAKQIPDSSFIIPEEGVTMKF